METVLKAIADWIKGILTAGIMSNLSGLFDDVNTQVGNIAQQVGTKPSSFEPRVFAMIEALSRNVVLPIAGIILTFIACYELIEMITQHNNMAQFEPALIMRWIFKTAVSVWFISNTFDIVMAVFDLTQKVVSDSSGIIAGNTRVNDIGLSMLQSSLEQIKEAVYLINDERYLHLRENGAGVGFATYNKVTGEPLESGQISEKNLPPDGRNAIPAARNWYLFELSDDDRKVIQQESVKILENIPQAGIGRRRIWEPETLPKDIRLINSHYDDLYRIPDGGVIQVDYPDGRSFTARVEHLDDYHFDMGGLGNVFHICQFAEVMERNHADFYPEIQTQDEQAAWELGGKGLPCRQPDEFRKITENLLTKSSPREPAIVPAPGLQSFSISRN